ncbi:MAG: dCMP deaminase [Candidatus Berkelbacteria bacterium Licking1014_85]|uniref:dCMP deaminase n=1 Tax=Candidatus Berkelbacteria bacterium Licking1014_85 TaxID=2017148 RepID=A0A554LKG1_9BACT|nr:MAG: dCMP deaminase [Candidatus Berkelbacteria bacterium Licking1014_85]
MANKIRTHQRPSWDEYFRNIAELVSTRSNCIKRHVGAILVKDKKIISTGYNGTPKGIANCDEGGCPRCNDPNIKSGEQLDRCICVHAEENTIIQAAYHGVSTEGAAIYCNFCPCNYCTKHLINAGIKEVIYWDDYYKLDEISLKMLKEAKIKIRKIKK